MKIIVNCAVIGFLQSIDIYYASYASSYAMHPSCKQTIACVSLDYLTVCLGKMHQAAFQSLRRRSENFNLPE